MIDRLNAPALSVTDGVMGKTYTPSRSIEPVWGRLTAKHPNSNGPAHHFQWEQVYQDEDKEWQAVTDLHDVARGGYGSTVDGDDLFNPAVEINAHAVEIGTVVRLVPSRVVNETYQQLPHRLWVFSYQELRPFKLTADLIPTGSGDLFDAAGAVVGNAGPQASISAEWLDNPGETVTLYPEHRSGFPSGDTFFSLGIGRGPGAYFRGTYGWARYQPKATAYMAADGTQKWRGEWQIVTLYADLIAEVYAYDSAIAADATEECLLLWQDKHQETNHNIESGYSVKVYNLREQAIPEGTRFQAYFSRPHYRWEPMGPPSVHGISIYDTSVGQNTTVAYVVMPMQGEMCSYGYSVAKVSNRIKNISSWDVIGIASWQVCARRDQTPVSVAPGPTAIFHAKLFLTGVAIAGTESRLSSSRVRNAGDGPSAVNTLSGSVIVKIPPGGNIQLQIKHSLPTDANDRYWTVPANNHLTFHTIPLATLNP